MTNPAADHYDAPFLRFETNEIFHIGTELGNMTFRSEAELKHVNKVLAKYLRKRDIQYDGKKASISVVNDLWTLLHDIAGMGKY